MAPKDYIVGSGNVFEDIGHPRPAEALAKAELARKIAESITKRRLTQAAAAELLDIDQPKVSALVRGRLAGFSLNRRSAALRRGASFPCRKIGAILGQRAPSGDR